MFWVSKLNKLFHLVRQKDLRYIHKFGANNMFGITVVIAKKIFVSFLPRITPIYTIKMESDAITIMNFNY